MPHHDFSDPDVIVLKLKSGYNIGSGSLKAPM